MSGKGVASGAGAGSARSTADPAQRSPHSSSRCRRRARGPERGGFLVSLVSPQQAPRAYSTEVPTLRVVPFPTSA